MWRVHSKFKPSPLSQELQKYVREQENAKHSIKMNCFNKRK